MKLGNLNVMENISAINLKDTKDTCMRLKNKMTDSKGYGLMSSISFESLLDWKQKIWKKEKKNLGKSTACIKIPIALWVYRTF